MRYVCAVLSEWLLTARAEVDPKPTFETDPNPTAHATGLIADPKARSFEQFRSEIEFRKASQEEGWSFDYDVTQIGKFATGLMPAHDSDRIASPTPIGEDIKLKPKNLQDFGKDLGRVLDQGQCGSCVVFSILQNWTAAMRLRGLEYPDLSAQHLMNCGGPAGQCGGDYGARVAQRLVTLKTLFSDKDYPYTQRSARCTEASRTGERFGNIVGYKSIDGSPRTILQAIHNGLPVSVGVAANGSWAAYRSGVYNACNSMQTNHYVSVEGVDCGTSVDAEGYCRFDANGNLPAGVGTFLVRNNWSTQWGENGYMRTLITNRQGQKCNNIAGEGEILDIGIPMPPDGPTAFTIATKQVTLSVVIAPGANYSGDEAKKHLQAALTALGD